MLDDELKKCLKNLLTQEEIYSDFRMFLFLKGIITLALYSKNPKDTINRAIKTLQGVNKAEDLFDYLDSIKREFNA